LMVKRHGGSKATESGVDSALRWLAYHQEADGHWDAKKYGSEQKTDTAVTGMALLGDTDYTSCAAPQVDGACRTGNDFDARPVAPIRLAQRPAGSPSP